MAARPAADDDLLDTRQTAHYLGLEVNTLKRWRVDGTGPVWHRLSRKAVRYRRSDIDAWLRARRVDPEAVSA